MNGCEASGGSSSDWLHAEATAAVAPDAQLRDSLLLSLSHRPAARVWIAFSGGRDSTALLHVSFRVFAQAYDHAGSSLPAICRPALGAIHIDHGLHPHSARWAEHCRTCCADLGVPLRVQQVEVVRRPGQSLEEAARLARWSVWERLLAADEQLWLAQHQDDQAETLLLALVRGSGVHGLAAMPLVASLGQGRLVRPFLDVPRATLEQYARGAGLAWIDDPSNDEVRMDRNYLRRHVIPMLRARWPAVSLTLARSAAHCAEAAELIDAEAAGLLAQCAGGHPGTLDIAALCGLSRLRCKTLLRLWLRRRGFALPDARHLARILDELLPAGPDADPLVAWSGCEVRRYRADLFALAPLPPSPGGLVIPWNPGETGEFLELPEPLGRLHWPGVIARLQTGQPSGIALTVRFGSIGQSCRSRAAGHRRPLKKRFQELGIPRWLRPYVPLVFVDERLLGVAGVCACADAELGEAQIGAPGWLGHPWIELGIFT